MLSAPQFSLVNRRKFLQAGLGAGLASGLGEFIESAPALELAPSRRHTVTRIDRTTVKLSYRPVPGRNMARELPHWAWTEIVEVELASGTVGFGETLLYYTWGATSDDDVARARGKNAVEIMWDDNLGAGLQMALFDAVARDAQAPIHALLGTKAYDKTPLSWWNIDTSAEDMASECQEAHRQGYLSYKSKGRPWFDVWAQAEAVSKAVPETFHVAMDFNDTLLDAKRGIPILKDLAKYPQMEKWETPIFQSDIAGNRAIRAAVGKPVAMHYGNPPPKICIKEEACDGFVIGGGASRLMRQGAVAAMAEMPFWLQLVGTGITAAWSLQFGAVLSHATWPAVNCHQLYTDTLLATPLKVEAGFAKIPNGPGLGFDLDRERIAKLKVVKPRRRPNPPRLIETSWPDGRRMYFAEAAVNFMLTTAQKGAMPYFERGVNTRLVPDDGAEKWRNLHKKAKQGPFLE